MLPRFRIRQLKSSENPSGPDLGDDFLSSPLHHDDDDIVEIAPGEYNDLLHEFPEAALTYIDEDDGELITVGSTFELIQRLKEPVPPSLPVSPRVFLPSKPRLATPHLSPVSPPMHTFDIKRTHLSLSLWRDIQKASRSSNKPATKSGRLPSVAASTYGSSASVDLSPDGDRDRILAPPNLSTSKNINSYRKLELEDHRKRHFDASSAPKTSPWHLDSRLGTGFSDKTATEKELPNSSEPEDDELSRETTPLLKNTSPQPPFPDYESANLTVEGTRQAQKAGARIRSNLFPNLSAGPRPTTAEKAAHADRWASYGREKPGLPSAVSPLSTPRPQGNTTVTDNTPKPFLELFEDELQKMNSPSSDPTISVPEAPLPSKQNELPPPHQAPSPIDILSQTISSLTRALTTEISDTLPGMQAHLSNAQPAGPFFVAKGLFDTISGIATQLHQLANEATREAPRPSRNTDQEAISTMMRGIQHLSDGVGSSTNQNSTESNNALTSTSTSTTNSYINGLKAPLAQQSTEPKPIFSSTSAFNTRTPLPRPTPNNPHENTTKSCESIPEVVNSSLQSIQPLPSNDLTAIYAKRLYELEKQNSRRILMARLAKKNLHNQASRDASSEPDVTSHQPKSENPDKAALEPPEGERIAYRAYEIPHHERLSRRSRLPGLQIQSNTKDDLTTELTFRDHQTLINDGESMQKENLSLTNGIEETSGPNSGSPLKSVYPGQVSPAKSLRHNRTFLRGDIPYQRQADYSRGRPNPRRIISTPTYEYLSPPAFEPNVESTHIDQRSSRHSGVPPQRRSRSRSPPAQYRLSRSPPFMPPGWSRYPRHGPIHLPHDPPQLPRHPYRYPGPPPPVPPLPPAGTQPPPRPYWANSFSDAPRSPTLRHRRSWHPGFQRSQLEHRDLKPTVSFIEPTSPRSHRPLPLWQTRQDLRQRRSIAGPLREEFKYSTSDIGTPSRFYDSHTFDLNKTFNDLKSNSIEPTLSPLAAQPKTMLADQENLRKKKSWSDRGLELSEEHGAAHSSAVNTCLNTSAPNSPPSPSSSMPSSLRRSKTVATSQEQQIHPDSLNSNPFLFPHNSPISSTPGTPQHSKPLPPRPISYPQLQPSSPSPELEPSQGPSIDWLGQQLSNSQHPEMEKFPSLSEFEGLAFHNSFPALPSMDTMTPERAETVPAADQNPKNPFSTPPPPPPKQRISSDIMTENPPSMPIPGSWPSQETISDSKTPSSATGKEQNMFSAALNARLARPFDPLAESVTLHRSRILDGVRRTASDYRPYGDHYASDRHNFTRQLGRWSSQIDHFRGAVNHSPRTPIRSNEPRVVYTATRNSMPSTPEQVLSSPVAERAILPAAHSDASTVAKVQECVELLKSLGYGTDEDGGAERLVLYSQAADGDLEEAMEMIEEERKAWFQRG